VVEGFCSVVENRALGGAVIVVREAMLDDFDDNSNEEDVMGRTGAKARVVACCCPKQQMMGRTGAKASVVACCPTQQQNNKSQPQLGSAVFRILVMVELYRLSFAIIINEVQVQPGVP